MEFEYTLKDHFCLKRNDTISRWYVDYPTIDSKKDCYSKQKTNKSKEKKICKYCSKIGHHKSYDCESKYTFYHSNDTKKYIKEYKIIRSSTASRKGSNSYQNEGSVSLNELKTSNGSGNTIRVKLHEKNIVLDFEMVESEPYFKSTYGKIKSKYIALPKISSQDQDVSCYNTLSINGRGMLDFDKLKREEKGDKFTAYESKLNHYRKDFNRLYVRLPDINRK